MADKKVPEVPVPLVCNYHWQDPDGSIETCRHAAACKVCGQCSRIDSGGSEQGHCTGHLGLSDHIPVPGQEIAEERNALDSARARLPKRAPRPKKKSSPVVVAVPPQLKN